MGPMLLPFAYLVICLAIGLLGKDRKFGFWGYVFFSLLFSPILGFIVLLASDKRKS